MINAIKLNEMRKAYDQQRTAEVNHKKEKWMNKILTKATKRAKKDLSYLDFNIPLYARPRIAIKQFENEGFKVEKISKKYRLIW